MPDCGVSGLTFTFDDGLLNYLLNVVDYPKEFTGYFKIVIL